MDYDATKLDEVVLALLHLNARTEYGVTRAWKSFDWDSLDRLHAQGFISDPKSKAKSVVFTEEGSRRAEDLFQRHFGKALQRGAAMPREFSVIIERDADGYFVASVPALRGCHTQATSLDELMTRVREAVELCLEVQGESVEPLDFIGVQKITVA